MKYYLIEISEGDSKVKGKAVYEYDTLTEAMANYHSKLGSAMKSTLFTTEMVIVINSDGGVYASEKYVAEIRPDDAQTDGDIEVKELQV